MAWRVKQGEQPKSNEVTPGPEHNAVFRCTFDDKKSMKEQGMCPGYNHHYDTHCGAWSDATGTKCGHTCTGTQMCTVNIYGNFQCIEYNMIPCPQYLTRDLCPPGEDCNSGPDASPVPKSLKEGETCQSTFQCGNGDGVALVCDYSSKKCKSNHDIIVKQPLLDADKRRGEKTDDGHWLYNDIRTGAIVFANQRREDDHVIQKEKMTLRFDDGPSPATTWGGEGWAPCFGGDENDPTGTGARKNCTWDKGDESNITKLCDAYCYISVEKDQFTDADVDKANEPAADVKFKEVPCRVQHDLEHGEIFVMQLPWRTQKQARDMGRPQLEWCRNWYGSSDCAGNGLYVHKYIGEYGASLPFDGGKMQRVEFNFNTNSGQECIATDKPLDASVLNGEHHQSPDPNSISSYAFYQKGIFETEVKMNDVVYHVDTKTQGKISDFFDKDGNHPADSKGKKYVSDKGHAIVKYTVQWNDSNGMETPGVKRHEFLTNADLALNITITNAQVHQIRLADKSTRWNIQEPGSYANAQAFCAFPAHNGCKHATVTVGGFYMDTSYNVNGVDIEGPVDYIKKTQPALQKHMNFKDYDLFVQMNLNFSSVQAVNFNADLWQPNGGFQLSVNDPSVGAHSKANFDWEHGYNHGQSFTKAQNYSVNTCTNKITNQPDTIRSLVAPKIFTFGGSAPDKSFPNLQNDDYEKATCSDNNKVSASADQFHCAGAQTPASTPADPQAVTWDQELAGCGAFMANKQFKCHFWWLLNPVAQDWFNFIKNGSPRTYGWAYDEYYIPQEKKQTVLDIISNYKATGQWKYNGEELQDMGIDQLVNDVKDEKKRVMQVNEKSLQTININPNQPIFVMQLKNIFGGVAETDDVSVSSGFAVEGALRN